MSQVAVLALDAADKAVIEEFGCENIMLDKCAPLETEGWSSDTPSTKEIWPTIATGLTPDEHGLTLSSSESLRPTWDNKSLATASQIAQYVVPSDVRDRIGRYIHTTQNAAQSLPQTSADHAFDAAYQWVGVTPAAHVAKTHDYWTQIQDGTLTQRELYSNVIELTLDEFQWLSTHHGRIGAHAHILDVAGHTYARDEASLRAYYEEVNGLVGWLRSACDELIVLSDHGMQVSMLGDDSPGEHSLRAMVAATDGVSTPFPETIYDVYDWLVEQTASKQAESNVTIDAPEDHLRNLGYIK
ncbi:alkaline phosphatase family protein [Halobacterium salinarum]|uniref:alkaline phosphatase family protein n=1 Tax=Halobacterium salinarum TaxID=2242 RepID=UPI001F1D2EE5|nr:alkaline phosphatase family protein [Halobacterium salinarum]MCF2207527.1 alkaline phosphatase family protein [Halobacterium salinarum]MCF2240719.1 alkaline phosphatase family protein [Halobacterium salinarum]